MNPIAQRILVFIIGIPAVIALVLVSPLCYNLPLNLVIIVFSAIGGLEFSLMLKNKGITVSKTEAVIMGALAPFAITLITSFNLSKWLVLVIIMSGVSWALLSIVFIKPEKMETAVQRLAGIFSILVYPGFFMFWLVLMTEFNNAGAVILIFLFIVFATDSTAWLAGTLLGKNNRGIIPASPNKSIAGFIGGLIGAVIVSTAAALLFGEYFILRFEVFPPLFAAILLGLFTSIATIFGDLAESAIKRSCGVKDSGAIVLGRGGILDSIDSIAFASPVFFFLFNLFFIA